MMYTFIIVNIFPSPHVRESLLDKTMLFPIRKKLSLSLQFAQEQNILGHSFERRAC